MKQKGLWLSLFCVTLLLERVVGQCTSSVERQVCGAGNLEQQACTSNGCCYEASREPKCFINVEAVNPAQALTILQELPTPPAIENVDAVKRVASQVGARVDTSVSDSIEERALTFGTSSLLGLTLNFPVCPVNVPICHRTKCNSLNPLSESNPLICYQDPRCCFDKDLYVHKAIFGQQYMSDAPVCHYGPTSSRYVDITRLIVPWNPFYQEAVIKIFDSVFNNAINYQQQAVCAFTVAISVIAKLCLRAAVVDFLANGCNAPGVVRVSTPRT
uniref:P-type domain-containing protein n=1 Tax=Ciona savignyi TaxID=51511 RepID=H2YT55_CIOSA